MPSTEDIKKLISNRQRRLQKLKEQQAIKGISAPPETLTEIEDIEAELRPLRAQLEGEQGKLQQTLANLAELGLSGAQVEERLQAVESQLAQLQVIDLSRPGLSTKGSALTGGERSVAALPLAAT